MAAFEKSHEKLGGRKKGTRNKGTDSIKTLLNTSEEDSPGTFPGSRQTHADSV